MANASGAVLDSQVDVLNLTAGEAYEQGDLIFIGPYFGQVLNDAESGDTVSVDIEPFKRVQAISAVNGVGTAVHDAVYLNPTTGVFSGTAAEGYELVGYVTQAKDSANCFQFEKLRYPVAYSEPPVTLTSVIKVAEVTIEATEDYTTTGIPVAIPEGSEIVTVRARCTTANAGGTATVYNGDTAGHTAIAMAVAGTITTVSAGVVDAAVTVGTDAITIKTHAVGDAGVVQIWYV